MLSCYSQELEQIVRQELALGLYASEDELLLEAVRLLRQRNEDLRDFKSQLQKRLDGLDRGEEISLDDETALRAFFDDVQSRGRQRFEASRAAP